MNEDIEQELSEKQEESKKAAPAVKSKLKQPTKKIGGGAAARPASAKASATGQSLAKKKIKAAESTTKKLRFADE